MRVRLTLTLLCAALGAYAKTALLNHIPLQWKPTSQLAAGTTVETATAPVQFEAFQNVRVDKEKIGENREDDQPKPVTTSDDVGAFVSSHMRELFAKAGVKTVDSGGGVMIKGEVRQFMVTETGTYNAQVEVQLFVTDREGKTLFKGIASGEATRFGRSYRAENYYEVLSDAVVNTVSSMLSSVEIRKALAGS